MELGWIEIQNESNSQKIEEPGSYAFLIFTAIVSVFLFGMIFGFARVAIPEVIGILLLIYAAIALLIVFGTIKFYRAEGKKCFLISANSIQMKLPLKSLEEIKWADFDEISIVAKGIKTILVLKLSSLGAQNLSKRKNSSLGFNQYKKPLNL